MRSFAVVIVSAALGLSCSTSGGLRRSGITPVGTGGSVANGGSGSSSFGAGGGLALPDFPDTGGSGGAMGTLDGTVTTSAGDTITVTGQPTTVPFTLTLSDGSKPDPTTVTWSVDNPRIGSVDSNGVLAVAGNVGGVIVVTGSLGGRNTNGTLTVNVDIVDTATVAQGDRTLLEAGGGSDATFKWLYPYDKTVFPRGLAAPTLQLAGTAATAIYVKITTPHFSYRGYRGPATPIQIPIPAPVWQGLTNTATGSDPVQLDVSKLSGGAVSGPATESWYIAQATLKGIIYYSTYRSPLTGGVAAGAMGGGLLRIRPGQTAEVVQPLAKCSVCHSVSANGSVLALSRDNQADPQQGNFYNPVDSSSYNLAVTGAVTQRALSDNGLTFTMAALTPDGSMALTSAVPPSTWSPFIEHGVYSPTGFASSLVSTANAAAIAAPSLSALVTNAITPMFSPDGTRLAYVNGDKLTAACKDVATITDLTCRHVLSVLDVDLKATPPAFSNPVDLIDQLGGGKLLAYPSFLPDSQALIYHEGDSFDSSGFKVDANAQSSALYAELKLVELATKTVKPLNALNGRTEAGQLYLPYGELTEGKMNYEPNVLPLAIGGYYWVLFTSRRVYGNTIGPDGALKTVSPPTNPIAPGAHDPWGDASAASWRKKIWIAAISINHAGLPDPSHPAFLLPGQELESGNMRAFGALPPCKDDGQSCESGSDCCKGFCRQSAGATGGGGPVCIPPPINTCSLTDEPCDPALCCNKTDECINHRCTTPSPPIIR